jgi:hypothetical protein
MEGIKGYKVFEKNWSCRGFSYKVGKTYKIEGELQICLNGFHFCNTLLDCFRYYPFDPTNKVAEILATGEVITEDTKSCTSEITIVNELKWEEVLKRVNIGEDCTGMSNIGIGNKGNRNVGECNSGKSNIGNNNRGDFNNGNDNDGSNNIGDFNEGSINLGSCNKGCYNLGYRNKGNRNIGEYNNGSYNLGDKNVGRYNLGNKNIGDFNRGTGNKGDANNGCYNSGNDNRGNYNSGDNNCGCFNSGTNNSGWFCTKKKKLVFFDKETDMTMEEWIKTDAYYILNRICPPTVTWTVYDRMTTEERNKYQKDCTGGRLMVAFNGNLQNWWDNLLPSEKKAIIGIPNFTAAKFKKATGINVKEDQVWISMTSKN